MNEPFLRSRTRSEGELPLVSCRLGNGLVLLGEPMPWLRSASFAILVPAGCRHDPFDRLGLASLTSDMIQRGCGGRDSRQFLEDLQFLGVDYGVSVSVDHLTLGATAVADRLIPALSIVADMVRDPWLPEDQLEEARQVCFQDLRGLDDDVALKAIYALRRRHYGGVLGRHAFGTADGIGSIGIEDVRRFREARFGSGQMIVSVAGCFDWPALQDQVAELFGDLSAGGDLSPSELSAEHGAEHIAFDCQQTHMALAYPAVAYRDPEYYAARLAVGVMSDGLSSRLFREVRERRGLCYTVYATLHSLRDQGSVICYAGSAADRAQETLAVIRHEFAELGRGVAADELDRLKVQIRSGLVMQQESSRARAASMASDWFHLGRVRRLGEVADTIGRLTPEDVQGYVDRHPFGACDLVTLGPAPLEVSA